MVRPRVRPARTSDLGAVRSILNHYVAHSHATFDTEPFTPERAAAWAEPFADSGPHLLLVAEEGGEVIGFCLSKAFRPKPAYARTVETSVYLAPSATGRGLGGKLYGELFRALEGEGLHRAVAVVALPNPASVALHRRFGFGVRAVLDEVGYKFGRYWSVVILLKPLGLPGFLTLGRSETAQRPADARQATEADAGVASHYVEGGEGA